MTPMVCIVASLASVEGRVFLAPVPADIQSRNRALRSPRCRRHSHAGAEALLWVIARVASALRQTPLALFAVSGGSAPTPERQSALKQTRERAPRAGARPSDGSRRTAPPRTH